MLFHISFLSPVSFRSSETKTEVERFSEVLKVQVQLRRSKTNSSIFNAVDRSSY